jgi:hypothetical protein
LSNPKIDEFGNKRWYLNDKLHREDGPAVEHISGTKEWYLNDQLHREEGPAIEHTDGTKSWWLNNKLVYSDSENNTDKFELSQEMKKSIIKHKLQQ